MRWSKSWGNFHFWVNAVSKNNRNLSGFIKNILIMFCSRTRTLWVWSITRVSKLWTFLGWALSLTHIPNLNYPKWVSTQRWNSSVFISIPVLFRSLYVRIPSLEIRRSTMMDRPNTSGLYASRPLFFRVMDTSAELSETKTVWETINRLRLHAEKSG